MKTLFLILALHLMPEGDKSKATVNQTNGVYIFADCKPECKYTYLGTVKADGFDANYAAVRDRLLKKAQKEYKDFDGLILQLNQGATDKADVIKFDK